MTFDRNTIFAMEGGIRGKYADLRMAGTNLVKIDPDVVEVSGYDRAVNEALGELIKIAHSKLPLSD